MHDMLFLARDAKDHIDWHSALDAEDHITWLLDNGCLVKALEDAKSEKKLKELLDKVLFSS